MSLGLITFQQQIRIITSHIAENTPILTRFNESTSGTAHNTADASTRFTRLIKSDVTSYIEEYSNRFNGFHINRFNDFHIK